MRKAPHPIVQLTLWRVREFTREPEALFWVFAFPIVLAFALGLAFKNRGTEIVRVAVRSGAGAPALASALNGAANVEAKVLDGHEAENQLRTGRVALVVVPGEPVVLRFDSTRQESFVARLVVDNVLQAAAGRRDARIVRDERVTEPGARYIDFLIPGLLGMNIMSTGMWGIGYGLVKARNQKLLKRFLASPMRRSHFMLGFMLARLVFLALEVGSLLFFAYLVFHVPLRGSVAAVALVVVLGALTFGGLGLLVSSRVRTVEGVSGLMNVVMVPMWICSGVFFAYSHFPDAMQPFIQALPLTQLNDALRAVVIDGASLSRETPLLLGLAAWGVVTFSAALKMFRWE